MKIANILPQGSVELNKGNDYHMCLAHMISFDDNIMPANKYTEFYCKEVEDAIMNGDKEKYVIMDNSIIELGEALDVDELIFKANRVGVDEVVCPDSFQNKEKTLELAAMYLPLMNEECRGMNIMVVPQGKDIEEWVECASEMILDDKYEFNTIGVPKVLCKDLPNHGRYKALELLKTNLGDDWPTDLQIHLLGCWDSPLEVLLIEKQLRVEDLIGIGKQIRGIDTALAYVYTANGIKITEDCRPHGYKIDFENGAIDSQDLNLYEENKREFESCCHIISNTNLK